MAKKASAKNHKKVVGSRKPVPYERIAEMVKGGKSAMEIARKLGRENKGDDPSHTVRAVLSRMRGKGWRDKSGKLHKLAVARAGRETLKKTTKNTQRKRRSQKQETGKDMSGPEHLDSLEM